MPVGKTARIGTFARRLDLDTTDKRVADRNRVIRTDAELGKRGFPDEVHLSRNIASALMFRLISQ